MDKLSDYLPLIIIAVSLVFSVLGRKKKQVESSSLDISTNIYDEEWQKMRILADSFQKPVEVKPVKPVLQRPEVKTEKKISTLQATPSIIEPEEEPVSSFSFDEEDDVMRAIVYSEIINRKEY